MSKQITETQRAYLTLIREASFNEMDGVRIVRDMEDNTDLWEKVRPLHSYDSSEGEFKIRELVQDHIYIDTLLILPASKETGEALYNIVNKWKADEISWEKTEESKERKFLRVWFD